MSEFQTRLNSVPSGGFLTDRDKDKKPILDVRELGIDFGGLTAVDGFNLMIGRNEITGLIGPRRAKRPIRSTGWAWPVPSRTSVCSRR